MGLATTSGKKWNTQIPFFVLSNTHQSDVRICDPEERLSSQEMISSMATILEESYGFDGGNIEGSGKVIETGGRLRDHMY